MQGTCLWSPQLNQQNGTSEHRDTYRVELRNDLAFRFLEFDFFSGRCSFGCDSLVFTLLYLEFLLLYRAGKRVLTVTSVGIVPSLERLSGRHTQSRQRLGAILRKSWVATAGG
jgi:hypothetical protein